MWLRITSSWLGIVIGPILRVRAVVGAQVLGLVDELVQELVVHPLVDVDPLDAGAGLAGVGARAPQRGVGGGLDVGVLVDEQRVLAAGLDHHRGERLGAGGHHLLAGGRRAGERDLADAGAAQRGAGLAEAGDDLEDRPPDATRGTCGPATRRRRGCTRWA